MRWARAWCKTPEYELGWFPITCLGRGPIGFPRTSRRRLRFSTGTATRLACPRARRRLAVERGLPRTGLRDPRQMPRLAIPPGSRSETGEGIRRRPGRPGPTGPMGANARNHFAGRHSYTATTNRQLLHGMLDRFCGRDCEVAAAVPSTATFLCVNSARRLPSRTRNQHRRAEDACTIAESSASRGPLQMWD